MQSKVLINKDNMFIKDTGRHQLDITATTNDLQDALLMTIEQTFHVTGGKQETYSFDKFMGFREVAHKHNMKIVTVEVINDMVFIPEFIKGIKIYMNDGNFVTVDDKQMTYTEIIRKIFDDEIPYFICGDVAINKQNITRITTNHNKGVV